MKSKQFGLIVALVLFIGLFGATTVFAGENKGGDNGNKCDQIKDLQSYDNDNGDKDCNKYPTPTIKCGWNEDHPCSKPTPTCGWNSDHRCVTPTPTEVTPTPTQGCGDDEDCIIPTPSATPSATPTPTQSPSNSNNSGGSAGGGGGNGAPAPAICNGTPPPAPVITSWAYGKDQHSLQFNFVEPGIPASQLDFFSINFGVSPDNLNMGEDNIPNTSTGETLRDLPPGAHIWATVTAHQGNCTATSGEFDPKVR